MSAEQLAAMELEHRLAKAETELAAAKAEVERLKVELNHEKEAKKFRSNLDHETFMTLRADLSRHKRALDVARASLRAYMGGLANDALKEIDRVLEGKE